jgi:MPBQ/MSBQ methyltransferase
MRDAPPLTARKNNEFANTVMFILASILTGIMSALAVCAIWAKEKTFHQPFPNKSPFLADKLRALSFYKVFSPAYDILNPYLYTDSMRSEILSLLNGSEDGRLRILDVGCGTGYTTTGILKQSNIVTVAGLDMNPKQLARAHKNLNTEKDRVSLSMGDVENLPFTDGAFDAAVSVGAVEYFPQPEKAYREMARVVKRGGKIVVAGPELSWFRKVALDRFFYTPAAEEMATQFKKAELLEVKAELIGLDTVLGTSGYVVVAVGTKN